MVDHRVVATPEPGTTNSTDGDSGMNNNPIPAPRSGSGSNSNSDNSVPQWTPADEHTPPNLQIFGSGTLPTSVMPNTAVDTASLNSFVTYIGNLLPAIRDTRTSLASVQVEPGDFYDADQMRGKVNGSTGLASQFHSILGDLDNGLTSMQQGLTTLAAQYTSTEDLNNLSVSQLQTSFGDSSSYFSNITTDAGGSGSTTTTGSANSNNTNGSGNSNNTNDSGNSNTGGNN